MTHQSFSNACGRWIVVLTLIFAAVLGLGLSASLAWGQATAAAVNGTVRDPGGAVITQATVVLHNRDTNLDRVTVTKSVGAYVMPNGQPGNYDFMCSKT